MWYFLAILILPLIAAGILKLTFAKYNGIPALCGKTAAQVARELLDSQGLYHVGVVETAGKLSDHYDPRSQMVALSESTHGKASIGAIAVAAHEVGHAFQHAEQYAPMNIRSALVPVVNIASKVWLYLLFIGIFLELMGLVWVAIALFASIFLFQLVTLPLELDASRRAMHVLQGHGYLASCELSGAKKTLTAAAMTYVIAMVISLIQLLRLVHSVSR